MENRFILGRAFAILYVMHITTFNKNTIVKVSLTLLTAALIMTVFLGISKCSLPNIYSGNELNGIVLDADTNEPLKDIVVVAAWKLEGGYHGEFSGYLHIEETLTDHNGAYHFSKWGPKTSLEGTLSDYSPVLHFYKFGYLYKSYSNKDAPFAIKNDANSQQGENVIMIQAHSGSAKDYRNHSFSIHNLIMLTSLDYKCIWAAVPRYTAEIVKTGDYFRSKNVSTSIPNIQSLPDNECNDGKSIVQGYL